MNKKGMNKKGFTLIELLAVIVILAIIALIATPIIMGLIENARKESFKNTAFGIISAVDLNYAQGMLNDNRQDVTYTYENGVETADIENKALNYNGTKPKNGVIKVTSKGKIALAIFNGTWCAVKKYDSDEVTMHKRECNGDDMEDLIVIEEITPKAEVWLMDEENPNEGYMTLKNDLTSESFDLDDSYSTSLGGTSINAITHEEETYYLVSTAEQFNAVRHKLDGKFLQINDITISSFLSPIGATVGSEWDSVPFTGYYNGRGFKLIIESMDTTYAGAYWGLFPKIEGAELTGMNVIYPNGVYAGTPYDRGGLVAQAKDSTIKQSSVRIPEGASNGLTGYSQGTIGGLVGLADNTKITDCYFVGKLEITSNDSPQDGIGGLVGRAINNSLVERTYAVVKLKEEYNNFSINDYLQTVSAETINDIYLGGIIGYKDSNSIIRESYYNSATQFLAHQGHGIGKPAAFLQEINNFNQFGLYQQ